MVHCVHVDCTAKCAQCIGLRRYLNYSGDFDDFRPIGAIRCTDGVKFGVVDSFIPNFTPSVHEWERIGPTKPKIENFTQFRNINSPQGRVVVRDFYEIFSVCGQFIRELVT